MADLCCMAETNTTLKSNFPPIKNKKTKTDFLLHKTSKKFSSFTFKNYYVSFRRVCVCSVMSDSLQPQGL